ncbi:hypothetical protein LINPERHAP1_LOCUS4604 [Linum perenne]
MVVSLVYHVGEFVVNGNILVYEEGELVIIEEVDPVMITLFDLRRGISSTSSVSGEFRLYFKLKSQNKMIEYPVLNDEKLVRDLLIEYKDTNVYDIFVDAKSWVEDGVGINNEEWLEEDSEDNDFEVGSWIEEEDREELEEIRQKVQEAKSHLKGGIPITANDVEDEIKGFEGDEFSSDESGYYVTTDEDDEVADHGVRIPNPLPKYSPRTDITYFCHGMRFTDIIEVREALRKHAVKERWDIRLTKSDPGRVRARCTGKGCSWTFFVFYNKRFKTYQLKTYKEHSCSEHYKKKFVSPKFIANHYKRRIRSNPRWRIKDMRETIREDFGTDVSLVQCSRAKSIITHKSLASYTEEYALLRSYAVEILRSNPGSSTTVMVDCGNPTSEPLFQRMYVCFDALKKGFLAGC